MNVKRVHRVWKGLKLGRARRFEKEGTGSGVPLKAEWPNSVWYVDFIHDSCLTGTKLKVLSVVDEFTRDCLALEVGSRLDSARVRQVLSPLFKDRGAPVFVRSDNCGEFVLRLLAVFLAQSGSGSHFIKPGSPWQNGFVESFHSTIRHDCLDVEVFMNLADAQVKLACLHAVLQRGPSPLQPWLPPSGIRWARLGGQSGFALLPSQSLGNLILRCLHERELARSRSPNSRWSSFPTSQFAQRNGK